MNQDYDKLTGIASRYISVPASIIMNNELDTKRVVAYIYFALKHGKDNELSFTINHLVSWCGFTPNKHDGKINDKFFALIDAMKQINIISCDNPDDEKNKHSYMYTALFNEDTIQDEMNNPSKRFALLWVDEIKKIMSYQITLDNKYLNNATILLVFAYLRMMIYRRSVLNISYSQFKDGATSNPEAYNNFYFKMAEDLGISVKTLSLVLNILSDDLQLIYIRKLPTIHYKDKYRTDHTVFANTYKREGSYLITSGKDYYMYEVEKKLNRMKSYMKEGI